MRRRFIYLPFLLIFSLSQITIEQVSANQIVWTEKEVGRAAVKAEKAAARNKWSRAIKYGELMLKGSEALYGQNDPNYISRLKTLNRYYDKSGRLNEIADRVKEAYFLSKEHFKPAHNTAMINRLLYYKLLTSQKKYKDAIPLVKEDIALLKGNRDDEFRKLHYLEQLHGLYGLTDQLIPQENTLLRMLTLNRRLVGTQTNDNMNIILNLAKNYCLQKKTTEFNQLINKYNLKFVC